MAEGAARPTHVGIGASRLTEKLCGHKLWRGWFAAVWGKARASQSVDQRSIGQRTGWPAAEHRGSGGKRAAGGRREERVSRHVMGVQRVCWGRAPSLASFFPC